MKKYKTILFQVLFASVLLTVNCTQSGNEKESADKKLAYEHYPGGQIKSEAQTIDGKAHGLLKNYTSGGILESVYTFDTGIRQGPAVTYYPNGNAREKMFYKNGLKHGLAKMYYRTGELYRESNYVEGRVDGIRKSYYKNGQLMAEAPYRDGHPGLGLKEYSISGELLNDMPVIKIEEVNRLALQNEFILKFRLVPTMPGTIFYIGKLVDNKFLHNDMWPIEPENGEARYSIQIEKGGFRMETIVVSARYRTTKSNYGVVSRTYNLAIDNK